MALTDDQRRELRARAASVRFIFGGGSVDFAATIDETHLNPAAAANLMAAMDERFPELAAMMALALDVGIARAAHAMALKLDMPGPFAQGCQDEMNRHLTAIELTPWPHPEIHLQRALELYGSLGEIAASTD